MGRGGDALGKSDGPWTAGAIGNLNGLFYGDDKDLSVADISLGTGSSSMDNGMDRAFEKVVVDDDLEHDLLHEGGLVLPAAVKLGHPPLPGISLGVEDGHAGDFDGPEGLADGFEFRWLDNGNDDLHAGSSPIGGHRAEGERIQRPARENPPRATLLHS